MHKTRFVRYKLKFLGDKTRILSGEIGAYGIVEGRGCSLRADDGKWHNHLSFRDGTGFLHENIDDRTLQLGPPDDQYLKELDQLQNRYAQKCAEKGTILVRVKVEWIRQWLNSSPRMAASRKNFNYGHVFGVLRNESNGGSSVFIDRIGFTQTIDPKLLEKGTLTTPYKAKIDELLCQREKETAKNRAKLHLYKPQRP